MPRLTLTQLADSHAQRRVPRDKRNADLRLHGYDPAGPDGKRYRQLFAEAIARAHTAQAATDIAQSRPVRSDQVVLWFCPRGEFAAAVEAGLIDLPEAQYYDRLAGAESALLLARHRVVRCTAGVDSVLACLHQHDLPDTTEGRATAFAMLAGAG